MNKDNALAVKNAAVAAVAQALASPVRLQILGVLVQAEHSVDELAEKLSQSRANTSAQLKVLSTAGLLTSRRDGRRVYYRTSSDSVGQLLGTLSSVSAEVHAEMRELVHTYYHLPERLDRKSVRELKRRVRAGEVILLDLRPHNEHAAGCPSGALSVPESELPGRLAGQTDREIMAFCRGRFCVLAEEGTQRLRALGYRVTNLGASPAELTRLGFGTDR